MLGQILGAPGVRVRAFIQPAGNLALAHYTGRYRASAVGEGTSRLHLFRASEGTDGPQTPAAWNRVRVPPASAIVVHLTWDGSDLGAAYRLLLVDCASGAPLDPRPAAMAGSDEPPDFASYRNPSLTAAADVCHAIRRSADRLGGAVLNVTLVDPGGRARQRFNTPARSILPPADARADLVVTGAVPMFAPSRIEPFSSRGPNFDGRPRPHVVALDRLPVSGSGGFEPIFSGTSAAAAYLGGVSALLHELAPHLDAPGLKALLTTTAVSLDGLNVYGAGRVDPVAAAAALADGHYDAAASRAWSFWWK